MAEARQLQPHINDSKFEDDKRTTTETPSPPSACLARYRWWIQMIVYAFLVIAGQSAGTLLGRLYFDNGGKSEWTATLVQICGFPILVPFLWAQKAHPQAQYQDDAQAQAQHKSPIALTLAYFYIGIGVFLAADCMLYSIGLRYLPVTTYTLICATQLGFNSIFSYFLNNQRFTPYIVNSLVLLTISSVLLVFEPDPGGSIGVSRRKYAVGFVCTAAASAGYALMLSLTQIAFQRVIKKETIRAVVEMTIYQNAVATIVVLAGLFGSGDWGRMRGEMDGYRSGHVSYVMNLFWTAVSWQAFGVGCVGLIFKVSSLFSNVISILGLPVAPVLAVIFLGDKLTGLKGVAMALAMWGFASYMYNHYLDDKKKKKNDREEDVEITNENELGTIK